MNAMKFFTGVSIRRRGLIGLCMIALLWLASSLPAAAVVTEAVTNTTAAIEMLGQRVSENNLSNRTTDEVVAWVLMGVLVGAVAGMVTVARSSLVDKLSRIGLGLVGAFIGSMVVRVAEIDHGWGETVLSYEELAYSLVAAALVVILGRLIRLSINRKKSK